MLDTVQEARERPESRTPYAARAIPGNGATGLTSEFLHEVLLASAAVTPERPAVIGLSAAGTPYATSYRQLRDQAEQYAAELSALGIGIGDRVIVESDTSGPALALLIACASIGAPFVPVGPQAPDERIDAVTAAAGPVLHLRADTAREREIPEPVGTAVFGPGGLTVLRPPATVEAGHRRTELACTDPAYVIFTSGTTGAPKGVVMSHRAITSFFRGMLAHDIVGPADRVASTAPLQFDFSLLDAGLALGSGAALIPVPRDLLPWPRRLLRFLADTGATQVDGAPSIWRNVLRYEPERLAALENLRGVLYSGEEFPLPELRALRKARPDLRIVNCYGSTESVAASFTQVPNPLPDDAERLSIGRAHPGAEMVLVDDEGRVVRESGVVGEIHLHSPALFSGYWNDPDATRAALVPDPQCPQSGQVVFRTRDLAERGEDGQLYYRGRADSLVKVRGNRVDLGEIDRCLMAAPGVALAATLLLDTGADGDQTLVAFVATDDGTAGGSTPDESALRLLCTRTLPSYMVPERVHVLDELPLNSHGKIDRSGLRQRFAAKHTAGRASHDH
ncbi:AMP-binding protein [Streptomyces arboris]|uniref:D-alanine--poly(Phosphoribitol) ligase n=1 Tax=Streptomyces arboris TaxID=2600619 RepID=A0A5N5EDC8_9ACTN|nr:AMP-binding protein [Streptomyces arboris]KAB2587561.1 D-alanine--poly(phosphoribitol) ligase [Streptomyces arboris]